jgi:rhamnose utilization protein RhaD (predicted bifunctional aldolase and dehydrogenase)
VAPSASVTSTEEHNVSTYLDRLIALSRALGAPGQDLAILAEGNTSIRICADRMLVKASGAYLETATEQDFLEVDLGELIALLEDPATDDQGIAAAFDRMGRQQGRRPSVEAMMHAVCLVEGGARVVGHTHPIPVNALLCSVHAETLANKVVYPEQIVVLGRKPMLIPYIDPGLSLAREVRRRLRDHLAQEGTPPKAIYLANHGMFALGDSEQEVLRITAMAVKVSRIMQGALAAGGICELTEQSAERIHGREDEEYRRALLAASDDTQPAGAAR